MEDREILELFFQRSQQAVNESQIKYGEKLCRLAENLLGNLQDAEECVNDTLLGAWNSIPPNRPDPLLPYLYRTVRNLALKRYHRDTAQKRGGSGFDAVFSELENVLVSSGGPEAELDAKELSTALNAFLRLLSPRDRKLFLGRYWFGEAYDTLALRLDMTENSAMVRISRIRKKLKNYLVKRGMI